MKFLLFSWENVEVTDPSNLTDEQFEVLAKQEGGYIFNSPEEFKAAFNAEHFSTATHQLRIIESPKENINVVTVENNVVKEVKTFTSPQKAEEYFIQASKEVGMLESEIETVLDDCYFEARNFFISITWSS